MPNVYSWGRLKLPSGTPHVLNRPANLGGHSAPGLPFGRGRSYGDACLNGGGTLWMSERLDRIQSFDVHAGLLVCEPGVLLSDIQSMAFSQGWMLPVTPGTLHITVGGAVANDVHGKNHHRQGNFGHHLVSIELIRTDGQRITCGPDQNADWFGATLGGLGLTGFIASVSIQLIPALSEWMDVVSMPFYSMAQYLELAFAAEVEWDYTVAWVDFSHQRGMRGLFEQARFAPHSRDRFAVAGDAAFRIPVSPPFSLVNRWSTKLFNSVYFWRGAQRSGVHVKHFRQCLYPLDGIAGWNKIYGSSGFYQYQCVIPLDRAADVIPELFDLIRKSGLGSFLSVLKTFSDTPSLGLLSFPMAGVTLAVDLPNVGQRVLSLMSRLDQVVDEARGRIYLAKDARWPRDYFERAYVSVDRFKGFRDSGISSSMSRRLFGS